MPKKIINLLSTVAIVGRKNFSSYSASKSALWSFTRSLRRRYGNEIQVLEIILSTFNSKLYNNTINHDVGNDKKLKNIKSISIKSRLNKMSSEFVAEKIFLAENKGKEIIYIPLNTMLFLEFEALFPRIYKKIID